MIRATLCLSLTLLFACVGTAATPTTPRPAIRSTQLDEAGLAGDRAAFTLIARPNRWTDLTSALTRVTGEVIPPEATAQPIENLLGELWSFFYLGLPEGLDPERPIVIRLGEADDNLSALVNAVAVGRAPPALRHVFVFPARSVSAMRADLERRIVSSCSGTPLVCGKLGQPHVLSDDSHVFIVFGSEAPESAASLRAEPGPVFRWALQGDAAIAGHLRASALRGAASLQGAGAIHQALLHVDPGYAGAIRIAGMSEVLGLHLRSSPYGRELSDIAFAVESSPLSVRLAARLTASGVARLAAHADADPAPAGEAPIVVRSALDLRGVIAAAELPFGFRSLSSGSVADAYLSGGMGMHAAALLSPVASLRLFPERVSEEALARMVQMRTDTAMEPGAIHADVDVAMLMAGGRLFSDLARVMPHVYFRSKVSGGAWVGVITLDENAQAPTARFEVAPDTLADPDSLVCLERLGAMVSGGLEAFGNVSEESRSRLVAEVRRSAEAQAACVTDPRLAAERQGYLDALRLLPAL